MKTQFDLQQVLADAETLGKLTSMGMRWLAVQHSESPERGVSFGQWHRQMQLACKVDGLDVTEPEFEWLWKALHDHPMVAGVFKQTDLQNETDFGEAASDQEDHTAELKGKVKEIFEQLRAWRWAKAREFKLPPYIIASNRCLTQIALIMPKTVEELSEVSGVGPKILSNYGKEILQIVAGETCDFAKPVPASGDSDTSAEVGISANSPDAPDDIPGTPETELILSGNDYCELNARLCSGCGRPISPERLEVLPDTNTCVSCKSNLEGSVAKQELERIACPRCAKLGVDSHLVYRKARDPEIRGYFLGCSKFPDCRYSE